MDDNAQHNRSSPSVFGLCNTYDNGNEIKTKILITRTSCNLFIYTSNQVISIYVRYVSKYMVQSSIYMTQVYVSKLFPKYIFSISNILENIIIFYLKHNVKIMI